MKWRALTSNITETTWVLTWEDQLFGTLTVLLRDFLTICALVFTPLLVMHEANYLIWVDVEGYFFDLGTQQLFLNNIFIGFPPLIKVLGAGVPSPSSPTTRH